MKEIVVETIEQYKKLGRALKLYNDDFEVIVTLDVGPRIMHPNECGWVSYFNDGKLFIKKYTHHINENYPDMGCSFEAFTSFWGVDIETLSQLKKLKPDNSLENINEWYLFESVETPSTNEEEMHEILKPFEKAAGITLP